MGTDIHIFAERKQRDGTWELFDEPESQEYPQLNGGHSRIPRSIYDGRNYGLFAILANVRNGLRSEELFKTIDELRGVPDDLSPLAKTYYGDGAGWHNATWYYLEEIQDYDWSQVMQHTGFVKKKYAKLFKGNPIGFPWEKLNKLQNPKSKPGQATFTTGAAAYSADSNSVKVRWRESYRETAKHLLSELDRFKKVKKPLSVRIVMWFDS